MKKVHSEIIIFFVSLLLMAAVSGGKASGAEGDTGEAAVKKPAAKAAETPKAETQPKKVIANIDHFKYETKRLKNFLVSAAKNPSERETDIRNFLKDVVDASVDGEVGEIEGVALSEAVARIIFVLGITDEEQKAKIIKQFAKVMEEAEIPRSRINWMSDNAEKVAAILEKKKGTNAADGILFKYYGIEGKGHQNVGKDAAGRVNDTVKLMDAKNQEAPSDIIRKYNVSGEGAGKKKIIGLDLMYPSSGQPAAAEEDGKKDEGARDGKKDSGKDNKKPGDGIDIDELFKGKEKK